VDSLSSDAVVVARLADDTSSLSSLSGVEEEMIVDCFPVTTLSRGPSLVPIDISSVLVWGTDLLVAKSSPLLLSDLLVYFEF
jgi:hypothetical protein